MGLSTHTLRNTIKAHINELVASSQQNNSFEALYPEFQSIADHLEHTIQEKIALLQADFNDLILPEEYNQSVKEGFEDLERLQKTSHTCLDIIQCHDKNILIEHLQNYYKKSLIPLINILSKLENDYISAIIQMMNKKQEMITNLRMMISQLKVQTEQVKNSIFIFHKKNKIDDMSMKLHYCQMKRQLLRLSLHHDRLNLYYFTHDHPEKLTAFKRKADGIRLKLGKFKDVQYALI